MGTRWRGRNGKSREGGWIKMGTKKQIKKREEERQFGRETVMEKEEYVEIKKQTERGKKTDKKVRKKEKKWRRKRDERKK